jgi:hypothetical protein
MIELPAAASDTGTVELDVHCYGKGAAVQVDGNDLVHLTDIGPDDGTARVTVYSSGHETAPVLWTGTVSLVGHLDGGTPAPSQHGRVIEQYVFVYGFITQEQVDSLREATGMLPGAMGRWKGNDRICISGVYADKAITWARRNGLAYEVSKTERFDPPS